jgi:tripartite-type tricarboxylate transporter receptor subunit TctC
MMMHTLWGCARRLRRAGARPATRGAWTIGARCTLVAAAAAFALAPPLATAAYPDAPIRLVVPFPPGGPTDIIARELGARIGKDWNVPVVIDNRPGGNSFIATEHVARAPADGYTLLFAFFGTLVVNPSLYSKLPYDPVKDFEPITTIATLPLMLVVPPDSPIHSIQELVQLSREKPNRFTYATGGVGQGAHLAGALLMNMTGIKMTLVPYKGNAQAITDLLGGHVDMIFDGMTSSLPSVKAGKLRAIAVSTPTRAKAMPDLPTVAESGLPGFDVGSWFGLLAPAHTPKEVVDALNAEVVKVIDSPGMQSVFEAQGLTPSPSTPQQFAAFMRTETDKWAKVVKDAHITIEQ